MMGIHGDADITDARVFSVIREGWRVEGAEFSDGAVSFRVFGTGTPRSTHNYASMELALDTLGVAADDVHWVDGP